MQNRLQLRFQPEVSQLSVEALQWVLPPLILQPLVENAIQHGIDPLEEGGTITIAIDVMNQVLNIEVVDTDVGKLASVTAASGTGVSNVRSRLKSLYGGAAKLEFLANQRRGLRAVLTIPGAPL